MALLLLAAALLKVHQLATEPVSGKDIFSTRWVLILAVEAELALSLWLLSGVCAFTAGPQPGAFEGIILLELAGHPQSVQVRIKGRVTGGGA